jgi:hypothetical protein
MIDEIEAKIAISNSINFINGSKYDNKLFIIIDLLLIYLPHSLMQL